MTWNNSFFFKNDPNFIKKFNVETSEFCLPYSWLQIRKIAGGMGLIPEVRHMLLLHMKGKYSEQRTEIERAV